MSVSTDTIPPSDTLSSLKDAAFKNTLEESTTMNGVVDGAHTQTNGIISTNDATTPVEPVVIIADAQPADVNTSLLPKDNITTNSNTNIVSNEPIPPTNQPSDAPSNETPSLVVEEKKLTDLGEKGVKKEEIPIEVESIGIEVANNEGNNNNVQPEISSSTVNTNLSHVNNNNNNVTITSTGSSSSLKDNNNVGESSGISLSPSKEGQHQLSHSRSASNNSSNNNSSSNLGVHNELRSSARNIRNSALGIDEEEVDEGGVKVRKMRRKERTHSRIVLHHKKNLIGETIFKGHQSWVLMLNIQTGIRNAVGRGHSRSTISVPRSPVNPVNNNNNNGNLSNNNGTPNNTSSPANNASTPKSPIEFLGPNNFDNIAEFYASPRALSFPQSGSAVTIPHTTGLFKFKDYCPHAFRFLRHRFGIDTADYMVSLCNTQKNGENALRELPTPGKSGSLFFFSHDMRFIIKTIPKSEAKLLRALLPDYVDHIANDENTLLPKFFGLHRVKPHKGRQVRFLVMNNIFQTRKTIHERYDLKGSTLGRKASEEEKKKSTVTYKDVDFLERGMKIAIGSVKRAALLDQLQRDVKFLAKLHIMDYSLLVGVHNVEKEDDYSAPPSPQSSYTSIPKINAHELGHDYFHSIFQENDGGLRGLDDNGVSTGKIYYMGIIDILMLYSLRKKIEHTYKTLRYGKEEQISSVSPNDYATRFYEFVAAGIT